MKIGTIGAGEVAQAVARYAVVCGHQVILSNKSGREKVVEFLDELSPDVAYASSADAAEADIVLLAVPWPKIQQALSSVADWHGKILIDATNPYVTTNPDILADLGDRGASEIVAGFAKGARLVKAFNSAAVRNFAAGPRTGDATRVLFVSGDDAVAKTKVRDLIRSFGFAVIDLGGLRIGGRLQQGGGPVTGLDLLIANRARARAAQQERS
jgi:8-hydroxy-5-deazaflavin:NADPH oxidoreductase